MKALDLHVEDEVGRKLDALVLCDVGGELFLVGALDRAEGGQHLFDVRLHLPQLRKVGVPARADVFIDLLRHIGIVEEHPAAGRDAVRDVDELFGEALVPILEGIRLQDVGVDLRDAVDVRGDVDGKVRHVDDVIADDIELAAVEAVRFEAALAVDDLLIDVGKKVGKGEDVPLFERLRHDGMVGEVEGLRADFERLVEGEALVLQKAQKFGDGDDGVGVVELEAVVAGKLVKIVPRLLLLSHDVLKRGADEEVLLAQAQNFAHHRVVVGIEDVGDLRRVEILRRRVLALHVVEGRKVERLHGLCLPQAQRVDDAVLVAEDGHIVRDGAHVLIGKMHGDGVALDAHAPRVPPFEPIVALFMLIAVDKGLGKQAVAVADAVAVEGDVHRRRAFEIAGGKTAEAAVAERRVLHLFELIKVFADALQGFVGVFEDAEVEKVGENGAAHQKFCRKIAAAAFICRLFRFPIGIDAAHHRAGERVIQFLLVRRGKVGAIVRMQDAVDFR